MKTLTNNQTHTKKKKKKKTLINTKIVFVYVR